MSTYIPAMNARPVRGKVRSFRERRSTALAVPAVATALLIFVAACSPGTPRKTAAAAHNPRGSIVVGSFDFSEGVMLADLLATVLQKNGYPVVRAFNLGPRELVQPALQQGKVDIVPEYLGTALAFITLGKADVSAPPKTLYRQFQQTLRPKGVDPLALSSAQDQNGIVVTEATAARFNLRKVSDLKPIAPRLVFGGPVECETRPFCLPGLEKTYGLHFERFEALDAGGPLTVKELQTGAVDVALLFTTDPNIVAKNFVLLRDDRNLQPADNVVPVVRRKVLKDYGGGVIRLIDSVTKRLSTDTLRRLNGEVQLKGVPTGQVAERWLSKQGIIQ
jgi:osmoprotectant transport system substrate-binding protein